MKSQHIMNCELIEADANSDVDQIVEIDQLSFDHCMTHSSILSSLKKRQKESMMLLCVDARNNDVLGFLLMLRHKSRHLEDGDHESISITRMAVHPSTRERGVGRLMVEKAIDMAREIDADVVQFVAQVETISIGTLCFLESMSFILSATAGVLNIYERRV